MIWGSKIQSSIEKAETALLRKQKSDGSWVGEVELNPGPTAQAIMLHEALNLTLEEKIRSGAVNYILRMQNADGGWSPHSGAPSDVSLSLECYLGLRLAGMGRGDGRLVTARKKIFELGGIEKANPWTRLYFGYLGVLPWEKVQKIPIEMVFIPKWWPIQLEHLSYWVTTITIPMALAGAVGPGKSSPYAKEVQDELEIYEGRVKSKLNGLSLILRKKAIKKALKIIEKFTEEQGDFGGNSCTAMNVLMAFHRMGLEKEEPFQKGLKCLMGYAIQSENEWHLQTCQSHVWDTGFSLLALSKEKNGLGATWLKQRQIKNVKGQWSFNVDAEPGSWCFGDRHNHYPVTDCTAMALMALGKDDKSFLKSKDGDLACRWLMALQHKAGGWSAYQKYERGKFLNKLLKFKDIPEALVDLPKADVSAKVLEALCNFRNNPEVEKCIEKGREFLLSSREKNFLWKGNYGINYIYGTSFVASGLRKIDGEARSEWATAPREFFLKTQNKDGGWGEPEESYRDSSLAGIYESSVVQSAWALMGLNSCDDGSESVRKALLQGAEYLISKQHDDGAWVEDRFLGTVFPEVVYFRYELYPIYFPLMALQKMKQSIN
jgi:squalene-hopene/tetraprenyl-beta-curcumene cyclase